MKKFLLHSLLFFISTSVIYLLVFAILFFIKVSHTPLIYRATQANVWEGGGTYIKTREFNFNEMHDIIIIGSSHAYRGYDPRIFEQYGYKTYNLGTSDQNLLCSYFLSTNMINHTNCKMVIFDLYDRVFTQFNLESNSDMIQNIVSDKAAWEISLATKDIRTINMFTLRLFNKLAAPLDDDTVGYIKGFLPTTKNISFPLKRKDYKYRKNTEALDYLDKTLAYFKKEGIRVVMSEHALPIVSPAPAHAQFIKDVKPVLDKYNIPWFDYTTDTSMTNIRFFADESHLNVKGVYKYNHRLIDDLQKANLLPLKKGNISTVSQ